MYKSMLNCVAGAIAMGVILVALIIIAICEFNFNLLVSYRWSLIILFVSHPKTKPNRVLHQELFGIP